MNMDFQNLNANCVSARISKDEKKHAEAISGLRENLKKRNSGNNIYVGSYTQKNVEFDISTCSYEDLLKINGDMIPMGI